jgi:CRISPR/Cas system-associated exonuclease Cas4 (RecB family)
VNVSFQGSAGFTFSQASLQDYADCPRRFQLRYVLDVRWPADRDGPVAEWERKAQLGAAFHRLVHQHTVGIPEEALSAAINADKLHPSDAVHPLGELRRWWLNYLHMPPDTPGTLRRSELRLTTPVAGCRLMARYDLLAIEPGQKVAIVDWKTNEKRPPRAWLEDRWQTRVYRYVLVQAGAHLNAHELHPQGVQWAPEQIELIYWFASYPAQPERFPYDDGQYAEDELAIEAAIAEIASIAQEEWTLTDDLTQCWYCAYRTLCDREKVDAEEPAWDAEEGTFDLELEQIAEIEF